MPSSKLGFPGLPKYDCVFLPLKVSALLRSSSNQLVRAFESARPPLSTLWHQETSKTSEDSEKAISFASLSRSLAGLVGLTATQKSKLADVSPVRG